MPVDTAEGPSTGVSGTAAWTVLISGDGVEARALATDPRGGAILAGQFNGTVKLGDSLVHSHDSGIFLARHDALGQLIWAKVFDSEGSEDDVQAMTTDAAGAIIVFATGDHLDFGCGQVTGPAAIVKLDRDGACLWSRAVGSNNNVVVNQLAVDPDGSIIAVGENAASLVWPGGPFLSGTLFITRLTSDGMHDWTQEVDGWASSIHAGVDASGAIHVTLAWYNHIDVPGTPIFVNTDTADTDSNILLARFARDGTLLGYQNLPNPDGDSILIDPIISVAPDGTTVIGSLFSKIVDFGGGQDDTTQGTSIFIARWAPDGTLTSAKQIDGGPSMGLAGLGIDPLGNVDVALLAGGVQRGHVAIDSQHWDLESASIDLLVGQLAATGDLTWMKQDGGETGIAAASAMAIAPLGAILLAGDLVGSVDFGSGQVTAEPGVHTLFLTRLAP